MRFPKKKWSRRSVAYKGAEEELQKYTDDLLKIKKIYYIRIPDTLWKMIHYIANEGLKAMLRAALGGVPDNTCMIPINEKYSVAMCLELKSNKGKLHGKQKIISKKIPWILARSPEEVKSEISKFEKFAEKVKENE